MRIFVITLLAFASCEAVEWSYAGDNGPDNWADVDPRCGGMSQSPINIDSSQAMYDEELGDWELEGYNNMELELTLQNNGHAAVVNLEGELPTLSGGGLEGNYRLLQFHVHVGEDAVTGSEHTIDGKAYAAELHFVHIKEGYSSVAEAGEDPAGLAVLGVMLAEGGEDNADFNLVTDFIDTIQDKDDEQVIPTFALDLLLPNNRDSYYRYSGSLTTPTCNEIVAWTVFTEPIYISVAQLEKFRVINDGQGEDQVNNYRPVQPLNGRMVHTSSREQIIDNGASGTTVSSVVLLALGVMAVFFGY